MAFSDKDDTAELAKLKKSENGAVTAPEHVVSNETQVRHIFKQLRDDHLGRAKKMAKIRRMFDNHPPFDPEKLRKEGRTDVSNTNLGDGKNIFKNVGLNYWSLVNEDKLLVDVKTDLFDDAQNVDVSNILSELFTKMLRDWCDFEARMQEHQNDYIGYGFSVFHFPNDQDWRPEPIEAIRFFLPKGAQVDVESWSRAAAMHTMTAQELWGLYKDEKADSVGWNKKALGTLLYELADTSHKGADEEAGQGIMRLLREISAGDTLVDSIYNDDILLVSVYIKEWSGKISRYIIHPSIETEECIFIKEDLYEGMEDAFLAFPYEPGEKYVHNNKGLGASIYNAIQVSTRIDNHMINSITRSGTVLVQSPQGGNNDIRNIKFSHDGFVDIGTAKFEQSFLGANIPQLVAGANFIGEKIYNNNDVQSSTLQGAVHSKMSATEVTAQMQHRGRVNKSRLSFYLKHMDKLYRSIGRRVWGSKEGYPGYDEGVKWFKDQVLARGIDKSIFVVDEGNIGPYGLPQHLSISAVRVSGSGSQAIDAFEMQQTRELLPFFGERGRANVIKHSIRAIRGSSFIDVYFPPEDQSREPTGEHSLAAVENGLFGIGRDDPIVSPDNQHAPHLETHMPFGLQIMELYRNGQYDLQEADSTLRGLVPHIAEHLAPIQPDTSRKAFIDTMYKSFLQLVNFADEISGNARKQRERQLAELQRQQQEKQQLGEEQQVALYGEELKHQRETLKLKYELERQARSDRAKFALKAVEIRQDAALKRLKAGAELSLEQKRMAAEADAEARSQVPTVGA